MYVHRIKDKRFANKAHLGWGCVNLGPTATRTGRDLGCRGASILAELFGGSGMLGMRTRSGEELCGTAGEGTSAGG